MEYKLKLTTTLKKCKSLIYYYTRWSWNYPHMKNQTCGKKYSYFESGYGESRSKPQGTDSEAETTLNEDKFVLLIARKGLILKTLNLANENTILSG